MTQMNRAMRYRLVSRPLVIIIMMLSLSASLWAQVPQRPTPPRLVNDLAGILTQDEASQMESALVDFANKTSNQIVVAIISDLGGMDKFQMAYSIGEQWKVGQEKFDNGVVILVKPKTAESSGEAYIATGYGLEGALPDAICKRIIEQEMIPLFRENQYYNGIVKALSVIMSIAAGEYSSDEYAAKSDQGSVAGAVIVILFVIFFIIISIARKGKGPTNFGGGGKRGPGLLEMMILGSMLSGRGGRSGGFGGGSFGGGSFGGGGFGGFGGGSFGGGGAGGSW